jgi:hypothetical protein
LTPNHKPPDKPVIRSFPLEIQRRPLREPDAKWAHWKIRRTITPNPDLLDSFIGTLISAAEQVQNGQLTIARANEIVANKYSELVRVFAVRTSEFKSRVHAGQSTDGCRARNAPSPALTKFPRSPQSIHKRQRIGCRCRPVPSTPPWLGIRPRRALLHPPSGWALLSNEIFS